MEYYRGDIFYVVSIGADTKAWRPAVIVSNNKGNKYADRVEVVYLTSAEKKPMPTHVPVMCLTPSTALCESIYTVDKTRLGGYIRCCSEKEMADIDKALMISLGLEAPTNAAETAEAPPPYNRSKIRGNSQGGSHGGNLGGSEGNHGSPEGRDLQGESVRG